MMYREIYNDKSKMTTFIFQDKLKIKIEFQGRTRGSLGSYSNIAIDVDSYSKILPTIYENYEPNPLWEILVDGKSHWLTDFKPQDW